MRWWPRRRSRGRGTDFATTLDREATREDLDALAAFVRSRGGAPGGVELYVEPETTATDTTAVAVAGDGEWMRRRVGSPRVITRLAAQLGVPCYDAARRGYPQRMRDWNAAHPERRLR